MFVILLHYVKPLTEIDRLAADHGAFLDRHYAAGRFLVSGRKVPRTGGVILARARSREELDAILSEDPFAQNGAAEYTVIEFQPTKHAAALAEFLAAGE